MTADLKIKTVITNARLSISPRTNSRQVVGAVFINGSEHRVYAPHKASGDALDWLDHLSVFNQDGYHPSEERRKLVLDRIAAELQKIKEAMPATKREDYGAGLFFHVRLYDRGDEYEVKWDMNFSDVKSQILNPYREGEPILMNGRTVQLRDLKRVEIFTTPYDSTKFETDFAVFFFTRGDSWPGWCSGERNVSNVSDELVKSPPNLKATVSVAGSIPLAAAHADPLLVLCHRFSRVARQLLRRRQNRPTLVIEDEYDAQDLFHALLKIFFDDVRPEEWTPGYAGNSARMDFVLKTEQTVVELKKTRDGLTVKDIADQLIIDITRYSKHPDCKRLVCFVYDPENRIGNPAALESDLSEIRNGLTIKVVVAS